MKTNFLAAAALLIFAFGAFGQGEINFDNVINRFGTPGEYPGAVYAPFYGVDPANPNVRKVGNSTNGVPVGTQTYGGRPLSGTNFTATLWAANSTNVTGDAFNNNLALIGTTVMRTSTSGVNAGRVALSPSNPVVPDVAPGPGTDQRGTFQVRVWDNRGGTVTNWDQVQADPTIARGFSDVFTVPYPLGGVFFPPPNLEGLQSFQLFVPTAAPPLLTCPTGIVMECSGGLTPVTFNVSAFDFAGNALPVICTPPSGTSFPIGRSNVLCRAIDSAGLSNGCTFAVSVVDTTPPRVTCPGDITATATNTARTIVNYVASASDPCGLRSFDCSPPSGSLFATGVTTVACMAVDSAGNPNSCTFRVTVLPPNEPPECRLAIVCSWAHNDTAQVIALNDSNACVILDASGSSDPENNPLQLIWILDETNRLAGAVVTNCLDQGCHSLVLEVSDGLTVSRCATNVCVLTAPEAVEQCIELLDQSAVSRKNTRQLLSNLKGAFVAFDRGDFGHGINALETFQKKVGTQIAANNPREALALIECAQHILDAIECAAVIESNLTDAQNSANQP